MRSRSWLLSLLTGLAACSGGGSTPSGDQGLSTVDAAATDAGDDRAPDAGPSGCRRPAVAPDRDRFVVISHPYGAGGAQSNRYAVWRLSASGQLSATGEEFQMGRATWGEISFTPDGEIGLVAQTDGTLGAFRIDRDGQVEVIEAAFDDGFYASSVVIDDAGERAYVVDRNWRENGGGVYAVAIGCDGALTGEGRLFEARLPAALAFLSGGRAVLAADDAMGSPPGQDAHLLAWNDDSPSWVDAVAAFDGSASIGSAAISVDQRYLLLGDVSTFTGQPQRIAVVRIGPSGLDPVQVIAPITDPFALVISPFDGTGIAISGFGDAIYELAYDAAAGKPFSNAGELDYDGPEPQLPGSAVLIGRGSLRGRVLVSENLAIRQVDMPSSGGVRDLGPTSTGTGFASIVGAIGVQP